MRLIPTKNTTKQIIKSAYWFAVGFILMAAILSSVLLFYFQFKYSNRVIPGIFVENIYIGEMDRESIKKIFDKKNESIANSTIIFQAQNLEATTSAREIKLGYDSSLIADQALSLGKTKNLPTDVYIILTSYINGTFLNTSYSFSDNELAKRIEPLKKAVYVAPVDAQFKVENNRVAAFTESKNGVKLDDANLAARLKSELIPNIAKSESIKTTRIDIPVVTLEPDVTTQEANNFGIVEEIGQGNSTFLHSIPSRVHNVALATTRINGVLVEPGEEFSFAKYLGDVSKYTGYKEAYVIQNGRTVLGDGGGVCQVSTTLFRAVLNAGLPITERHAHAYRVGYYEQDEPPGLDATVYVPTVDLKFKNDTGKHILIQGFADTTNLTLSFILYGTSDGRTVEVTKPVISNYAAPPPPIYQDDPNLPVGQEKQVEHAAPGSRSTFKRVVKKNGQIIIDETFTSNYRPWQAVFLRGTKT